MENDSSSTLYQEITSGNNPVAFFCFAALWEGF